MAVRKGPWTSEEDAKLVDCITLHGEGRWNSLACLGGLNRTGKSCRLRWLNYLRPNLRRGKLTIQEQLLILELHSRLGNRWSKIAEHLPGRTDNDIKNYWRTRVQKQARRLNCDANSHYFRYALRTLWLRPGLVEQSSDVLQSTNSFPDQINTQYWTHQTGIDPTFTGYGSHHLQGFCSSYTPAVPVWNDSWESHHASNKCNLETFPLCPSDGLLRDTTGLVELLHNQARVDTEPLSPDHICLTGENFWLLPVEQTLESLISS